jgi:protein SCO1/2
VDVDTGEGDAAGTALIHTETVVLLDGRRRIRGVYSGTMDLDVARLREDLEALLAER